MSREKLIFKIVAVLVCSTAIVGILVGSILFNRAITETKDRLSSTAKVTSRLIASVVEYERGVATQDRRHSPEEVALEAVKKALDYSPILDQKAELLLIKSVSGNLDVVSHDSRTTLDHDHGESRAFYQTIIDHNLAARDGIREFHEQNGSGWLIAFSPVEGTEWIVLVEQPIAVIVAPFREAAMLGTGAGILIIMIAAAVIYRHTMNVVEIAVEAESDAERARLEVERAHVELTEALDVSNEGFALFDAEDKLVICNDVYKGMYATHGSAIEPGNTFEEIVRAGVQVKAFPEAIGREEDWIQERIAQHRACKSVEQPLSDGRWLLISERGTRDGGIIGVRTDITALKEREEVLRDMQEKTSNALTNLETAQETAHIGSWVLSIETDHLEWSDEVYRIFGFDRHAITDSLYSAFIDRMHPDDLGYMQEEYARAVKDPGYAYDIEHRIIRAETGEVRWIHQRCRFVRNEDGHVIRSEGTVQDITERKQAELAARERETRLQAIFDASIDCIITINASGEILTASSACEHVFGYASSELIGAKIEKLIAEPNASQHDNYLKNYLATGRRTIIGSVREVEGIKKCGTAVPLRLAVSEISVDGEPRFVGILGDLSEAKLMEEKLRHSQKMEAVGQLVGGIAHDFNNLLGVIVGNLDLMARKLEGDDRLLRQVTKALNAANRGANLTRRLLTFSRKTPSRLESVDVNETISDLGDLIRKSLTSSVTLELGLDETIPFALTERGDLEDAITNLCLNARDAMPGSGTIRIETSTHQISDKELAQFQGLAPGRYVEINVSDNGAGMSPEVQEHIFEPFFTTKEVGKGTGLGLSMVYGFVQRSKGVISTYSEVGIGTSVKMFLPCADGMEDAARGGEDETLGDLSGTEKILIVDDETDLIEIAEAILGEYGYETTSATSADSALDILNTGAKFDLVLTDVIMPGKLNGYQLVAAARAIDPALKFCLTSGFSGKIEGILTENILTEHPLLKKPYTAKDLAKLVRETLDRG